MYNLLETSERRAGKAHTLRRSLERPGPEHNQPNRREGFYFNQLCELWIELTNSKMMKDIHFKAVLIMSLNTTSTKLGPLSLYISVTILKNPFALLFIKDTNVIEAYALVLLSCANR